MALLSPAAPQGWCLQRWPTGKGRGGCERDAKDEGAGGDRVLQGERVLRGERGM